MARSILTVAAVWPRNAPCLVLGRLLHTLDHQHVHGPSCRVESQSKLFLNCSEYRRARWITRAGRRDRRTTWTAGSSRIARSRFRSELQSHIEITFEIGFVGDRSP